MAKVKSLAELKAMREKLSNNLDLREKSNDPDSLVQIKVAMATCGIAAGAKQVMEHMMEKADELKLSIVFTQTGCMGYCHAEPTIEVKCPGRDPIVFGHVDAARADEILTKYVMNNEWSRASSPSTTKLSNNLIRRNLYGKNQDARARLRRYRLPGIGKCSNHRELPAHPC